MDITGVKLNVADASFRSGPPIAGSSNTPESLAAFRSKAIVAPSGDHDGARKLRGLVCNLRNALSAHHFYVQVKIFIYPSVPCERDLASVGRKRRHHLLSFEGREWYRDQRRISFCLLRLRGPHVEPIKT